MLLQTSSLEHHVHVHTQTSVRVSHCYTHESGEPLNLVALFEGLRVVE